jgi:hypothetical protein
MVDDIRPTGLKMRVREQASSRRGQTRPLLYSWFPTCLSSRTIWGAIGILVALLAPASVSVAQDMSRTALLDSLQARLRALEASVEVLQKQIAEAATTGVQTRSRIQLELNGRVVMNAFANDRNVNNVDDPQFVRRDSASALPAGGFGMAIRQTMLGVRTTVSDVAGGTFRGVLDVDFYGGQQPSSGGRTFPLLRLRTAHGTLRWPHGEILFGQEIPLFSPLNPVSPASVGTPGFVAAGNLWLWLPQIRVTGEVGSGLRLALQGAVLAPTSSDAVGLFDTDFDAAERSRKPYLESRVRLRWGEDVAVGELGCSVHVGWVVVGTIAPSSDSTRTSKGVGCDAKLPVGEWLDLRGEAYTGELMRGLGGGAIGQGIGRAGRAVRNTAGWGQLNFHPPGELAAGVGCGVDEPRRSDLTDGVINPAARLQNRMCAVYATVRPAGPVFVGAEVRRIETRYNAGVFSNNHFNIAIGFEF